MATSFRGRKPALWSGARRRARVTRHVIAADVPGTEDACSGVGGKHHQQLSLQLQTARYLLDYLLLGNVIYYYYLV